jgi:DNA adenine methylase
MSTQIQPALFPTLPAKAVVNVASVKHLSPFRYPGGKTWLVPRVRWWLYSLPRPPKTFIEPFCGGGIVSLTMAAEELAKHVVMVELDEDVAAVWRVCLSDRAEWLARRVLNFELTQENVQGVIEQKESSLEEHAFKTILRNRVNHGGILAPGSGVLKNGENGKGLSSRWYPETLAKRIRGVFSIRDRIDFVQGDGISVIEQRSSDFDAAFFIDPPYTAGGKRAGSRLYTHSELDHNRLFDAAAAIAGDLLMTYDNADEICDLAKRHSFQTEAIAMKNTHHAVMTELLVGRDLGWAR